MPYSPAFCTGLPVRSRPVLPLDSASCLCPGKPVCLLPLDSASHLCPGNSTSPLCSTTSPACSPPLEKLLLPQLVSTSISPPAVISIVCSAGRAVNHSPAAQKIVSSNPHSAITVYFRPLNKDSSTDHLLCHFVLHLGPSFTHYTNEGASTPGLTQLQN